MIRLNGPGTGSVTLNSDAARHADLEKLLLIGTTQASRLLVKVESGKDPSLFGLIEVGPGGLGRVDINGAFSGTLRSQGPIRMLHAGSIVDATVASSVRLDAISVDGRVLDSAIVAGLDPVDGELCDGNDLLGAGTIGHVTIRGSMSASSIAAGVAAGDDCQFGTADDLVEGIDSVSSIDRVRVVRRILGSNDAGQTFAIASADATPLVLRGDRRFMGVANIRVIGPMSPSPTDSVAPALAAALVNDTAGGNGSSTDGITSDPRVAGTLTDSSPILTFHAGFSETPAFDVTGDLQADGTFTLSRARLAEINGGSLPDGSYRLRLQASDENGNISGVVDVSLVLDTTDPATPEFDLAAGFDTPPLGDHETSEPTVTVEGVTERGIAVELWVAETSVAAATSDAISGAFRFAGIPLALGANAFTVRATDLAGNVSEFNRSFSRILVESVDPVLEWNRVTIESIRLDATTPPVATRTLAMVHAAIYDVVNALEGKPGFYVTRTAPADTSAGAAVAAAADRILRYAYPALEASLDTALSNSLVRVPDGLAETNGIALGVSIADSIIDMRYADGWDDFATFLGGAQPGQWRPTEPMFEVALLPQWAMLDPFTMSSPSQFRPAGPPPLESRAYADALNDVKALGRQTGGTRTPEQTAIARFWADGPGTYTPPGHWNLIAEEIAGARGGSLADNARLFAQLNLAMADAAIVAWDAKYAEGFWRPITAIQQADLDGNPDTVPDESWQPFLISPPFPDYVSGHSTFSAAAATILAATFGDETQFTTRSVGLPGVDRTFASFSAAAAEAGRSRIYGGIHYEFANQDGQAAGRQVANWVLEAFNGTNDTRPPSVIITRPSSIGAVRQGFTVTGRVLDNVSGVHLLTSQLDDGVPAAVAFDSAGHFSISIELAMDGTDEGQHTLRLNAADTAGNSAAPFVLTFTLDTLAPTIVLESPSLSADLSASISLNGTVNGTGSAVTALSYRVDGGTGTPIGFLADTSTFSGAIDISQLAAGGYTLELTASDAAGNITTISRPVELSARMPFTVAGVTPTEGSQDVGVTYRPQVVFSRPADRSSLNSSNLFATGPSGETIPATIVPASDGSFAWLFFTDPLPGGASVTLHIDGSAIRALADGVALDADGNGTPGGADTVTFTTVSLTPLLGTSLIGRVVDPGPDLKPMTFDDIRPGPDGTLHTSDDLFLTPIAGVRVFILGLESEAVMTDAAGRFQFDAVPAGNVKVAIDGRTATNAPAGFYFPEMVMDVTFQPGRVNTFMGSMGSREEMAANVNRDEVYLPRVRSDIFQDVSATEPTTVGVIPTAAPGLTAEERDRLTITVPPGSMIGHDGQPLAGGQVGISLVPPELVRDMLPPGILQHTFDFTVQAPGVDRFATPAPMTFPNTFDAAPGTQLNFLSFDHTTGRLVIEGTATVSPDGLSVNTDPGMGLTHPGWTGTVPAGTCGVSSGSPPVPPPGVTLEYHEPVVLPFATQDNPTLEFPGLNWSAPAATVVRPPPPPGCNPLPADSGGTLYVDIEVDGPLGDFAKGTANSLPLKSQRFALQAGSNETKRFDFVGKTYDEMFGVQGFAKLNRDQLYGAIIRVRTILVNADGSATGDSFTFYSYRWVSAIYSPEAIAKAGNTAAFHRTLADGTDGFVRQKNVDFHLPATVTTTFQKELPFGDSPFALGTTGPWTFDPVSAGLEEEPFRIKVDDLLDGRADTAGVGEILARGQATAPTVVSFDRSGYKTELARVILSLRQAVDFGTYPDGSRGKPGREDFDDDNDGTLDNLSESFYLGTNDTLEVVYDYSTTNSIYTGGLLPEVMMVGPDRLPGNAGSGGLGTGDDVKWPVILDKSKLAIASPQFKAEFAAVMPPFSLPFPFVDPVLNEVLDQQSNALMAALANDFGAPLSRGYSVVAENFLADVSMRWEDSYTGKAQRIVYGTADYDADNSFLRQQLRTPAGNLVPGAVGDDDGRGTPEDIHELGFPGTDDGYTNISQAAMEWALAESLNHERENAGRFAVAINIGWNSPATFAQFVANTVSHEIGHTFGLNDSYFDTPNGSVSAPYPGDIMRAGNKRDLDLTFASESIDTLKAALGFHNNTDLPLTQALRAYRVSINWPGVTPSTSGIREGISITEDPELGVTQAGISVWPEQRLHAGLVAADGTSGIAGILDLVLKNIGLAPVSIEGLTLARGSAGFSMLNAGIIGSSLDPEDTVTLSLRFDPDRVGEFLDTLTIQTNALTVPSFQVELHGEGISPTPAASLTLLGNNNLGGVPVSAGTSSSIRLAAISNQGAEPLRISNIRLVEEMPAFLLLGIPTDLVANPIELNLGQSFEFGIRFDPDSIGLRRAIVEITTNDPVHPTLRFTAVGTGLAEVVYPEWGSDFAAIETPEVVGAIPLRAETDSAGNFSLVLPSQEPYHMVMFDPFTGLVAHGWGTTGANSTVFSLNDDLVFQASSEPDTDFDGLPDDVEFAVGTAQNDSDTDNDGLVDFVEISLGLDPFGGIGAPTGVVAAISLAGEAQEVTVKPALDDPTALMVYVATGVAGLAIVDATQMTSPVLVGETDLPGVNADVDVDVERGLAVVAAGFAGLHVVDVSNPAAPAFVATVTFADGADRVEVLDGLAIVASGGGLVSVDLDSLQIRQTLVFGSEAITDISIEAGTIYTMGEAYTLHVVTLDGLTMTPRGSTTLYPGGGKIFVTDGVVFSASRIFRGIVGEDRQASQGFGVADVADPDNPVRINGSDLITLLDIGDFGVAANGSGLLVFAGEPSLDPVTGGNRVHSLDVLSAADLTNTFSLITRIPLPGLANAVALAAGFGFIANTRADLQIASVVPLDTLGLAPSAALVATPSDADPALAGTQVLALRSFPVTARVADDVQVRTVELLVNGQVVQTDGAAPWSLLVTPPRVDLAGDVLRIQLRATDTGGNSTLSNVLAFDVVADTTPPTLVDTAPAAGQRVTAVHSIDLSFDEGLDPAQLDASGAVLINFGIDGAPGSGDDVTVGIAALSLHDFGRLLTIVPDGELALGEYRLTVAPAILADAAGNQVAAPVELGFAVVRSHPIQAGSGSPVDPELASGNPRQEIKLVLPWGPEATRINFPIIDHSGSSLVIAVRPFRTDPATRAGWFHVPEQAVTGDVAVFGGKTHAISDLPHWNITDGIVDVFAIGNTDTEPGDLFVDLDSQGHAARIESKTLFDLSPGEYQLSFRLGSPTLQNFNSVTVSLGTVFNETFSRGDHDGDVTITRTIPVPSAMTARLVFDADPDVDHDVAEEEVQHFDVLGLPLDDVILTRADSGTVLLEDHFDLPVPDATFPFQIVPVVTAVDVTAVVSEVAQITLAGLGFIEGNDTIYRFGSVEVADPSVAAGPDVSHPWPNSRATLSLSLSSAAFGAVTVTTAGGTSAPFTVDVQSVTGTALSGTPADLELPSANPGQAVTVTGTNLGLATDFIVQHRTSLGAVQSRLVNPAFATIDASAAQLIVPNSANGAFPLRAIGSSFAGPLQVVPVLEAADVIASTLVQLTGRGFVEGSSSYQFGQVNLVDTDPSLGPDVLGQSDAENWVAEVPFPLSGFGNAPMQVTTAGGTSRPIPWNVITPDFGPLLDVAFDAGTGELLVATGSTIDRLDAATGMGISSFDIPLVGTPLRAGLQLLPAATALGGADVPAGALLATVDTEFGSTIVALNLDTNAGTVGATLASLDLPGHVVSAVVLDLSSGHLFILDGDLDSLVELEPATGAVATIRPLPFPVDRDSGGLAVDPSTGRLWIGSAASSDVAEFDVVTGTVVRRIGLAPQGVTSEISGLAFDAAGNLLVSSTLGVVYRLSVAAATLPVPSLTAMNAVATDGVPTDAAAASANAGQVIMIEGSNFRLNDLQVIIPTRNESGVESLAAIPPLAVNDAGTIAQVRVPVLATTGPVRVAAIGSQDLGFGSSADSIHRDLTATIVPSHSSVLLRFSDGGLGTDESWGLDNVRVTRGDVTVFDDDFEAGARAQWAVATTDATLSGVFTQFTGRFTNATQTISLDGLTPGETYTLTFDLYVFDGWDGLDATVGPDRFLVTADGHILFDESFSNVQTAATTFGLSSSMPLQIVPTISTNQGQLDPNFNPPWGLDGFVMFGSGFMEGASTVSIGGTVYVDRFHDRDTDVGPFVTSKPIDSDVRAASNNGTYQVGLAGAGSIGNRGLELDGPVRITTAGGWFELQNFPRVPHASASVTGLESVAREGKPADPSLPSANTGQCITLRGSGLFSNSALTVTFDAEDDTGVVGTITRSILSRDDNFGRVASIDVPASARTGLMRLDGVPGSFPLQIVPTVRGVSALVPGQPALLEGTGLPEGDLSITVDGQLVTDIDVQAVNEWHSFNSSEGGCIAHDQQFVTFTVPAEVSAGVVIVTTSGGAATMRAGFVPVVLPNITPAADVGDTRDTALQVDGPLGSGVTIESSLDPIVLPPPDPWPFPFSPPHIEEPDTDVYSLMFTKGERVVITFEPLAKGVGVAILTDTAGNLVGESEFTDDDSDIRRTELVVPSDGDYFLTVSPFGISPDFTGGPYRFRIERLHGDASTLTGISSVATTGIAARPYLPSANVGQVIRLTGTGLSLADPVVFATEGIAGIRVVPVAAAADGTRLDVVVPNHAITGRVRLSGQTRGVILQVVPVITNIEQRLGLRNNESLSLFNTGSHAPYTIHLGGATEVAHRVPGMSRVPDGLPTGPISLSSAGGTSAPFDGHSVSAVIATAISGTPANPALLSANAGQTITIEGGGFNDRTPILFSTMDASGVARDVIKWPATVNASGTMMTVAVPLDAVTGPVGVVGDRNGSSVLLQIVPVVTAADVISSGTIQLTGSGFIEGHNTIYYVGTGFAIDATTVSSAGIQVTDFNRTAIVPLPTGGPGTIKVATAGGISAPLAWNVLSPGLGALTGVAFDPAGTTLFAATTTQIHRLDAASGRVLISFPTPTHSAFGGPFNVLDGGLAIDPIDGNLWLGSSGETRLAELTAGGVLVQSIDVVPDGIGNEITGLAFETGSGVAPQFVVASSNRGVIYLHVDPLSLPASVIDDLLMSTGGSLSDLLGPDAVP